MSTEMLPKPRRRIRAATAPFALIAQRESTTLSHLAQTTTPLLTPSVAMNQQRRCKLNNKESYRTTSIRTQDHTTLSHSTAITLQESSTSVADHNDDESDYNDKIHCLFGHKDTVLCVAKCKFLLNNKLKQYIFSGSQDSSIGVWNTDTFQLEGTLLGHSRSILGLYVMNESVLNPLLVSTSRDNCICIWDIASLSLLFRITCLPSLVYDIECLSFANNGGYYLYGCCQDTNIFMLSLSILPYLMRLQYQKMKIEHQQKQQLKALKKQMKNIRNKSKSPSKPVIDNDMNIRILDKLLLLNKPSLLCPPNFKNTMVDSIPFEIHKTEEIISKKSLNLSKIIKSTMNFTLPTSTSKIRELISTDATVQFLSKSIDEMMDIYYDLMYDDTDEDGEKFIIHRLFGGCHRGFIYVMKQIQNEYKLITSASDGTCKIWDISDKQQLKLLSVLIGHTHSVIDFDLISCKYLVTASRDETLKVWNIDQMNKPHTRHTMNAHNSELTAIKAINAMNACLIVSAARNGTVKFWNGNSYHWIATYRVCQGRRSTLSRDILALSPDTIHKAWTCQADAMEQNKPVCVMRFAFIEPSWLLLADTANTVQIWDIHDILRSQCYVDNTQNTSVILHVDTNKAKQESIENVLNTLGLNEYINDFKKEKIDYDTLFYLTENDLCQISIPLGPRKKIFHYITNIKLKRSSFISNKSNEMYDMVSDLAQFVAFRSISCKLKYQSECWNAAYFIQSKSEQFGAETRLVQGNVGKNPVVLAKFCSSKSPNNTSNASPPLRIVMYGHYDVVDINNENGWESPPFKLTGRNGYLYGRGATDNKGPIIVFLYAIRELLFEYQDEYDVEFIVIIEGQEEYEWQKGGLTHVVEQNMDWLQNPTVIICSNSYWIGEKVPCLVYGMRGHLQLRVEINGSKQDCHSGIHGGVFSEPMFDLISILSKLKQNNKVLVPGFYHNILILNKNEQKLYDEIISTFNTSNYLKSIGFEAHSKICSKQLLMQKWRNPSLSVHNIQQSSNECTVISKCSSAVISIRTVPNQNNMDIIAKCKKYLLSSFNKLCTFNNIAITANNIGDHWLMDFDNYIFKCAEKAIIKHWGIKPYYIREGGTIPCTNYLHNKLKAPLLQFPLGQSTDRAHLENERIRLQNLSKGKDVIKSFLLNVIQHKQK